MAKKERDIKSLKAFLDSQYYRFNAKEYLHSHPDPLIIVRELMDFQYFDELALICALYSYGNASEILKNLRNLPFDLLVDSQKLENYKNILQDFLRGKNLDTIKSLLDSKALLDPAFKFLESFPYYRFQSRLDTFMCFLAMREIIENGGVKKIFLNGYKNDGILGGIKAVQISIWSFLDSINQAMKIDVKTQGLSFLFGKIKSKAKNRGGQKNKEQGSSPLKRYNMFLRWMVRCDSLDLGLWSEVKVSDLLLPLDTHTFAITQRLGLCNVRSYNLKAVMDVTHNLRKLDPTDPVKYDFALYRIGQLGVDIDLKD